MARCLLFVGVLTLLALSWTTADLRSDLKEFAALIPRRRIGYIAARYYIFDAKFRAALQFVRSKQFTATWQQMRATSEFADIVAYVTANDGGYDVTGVIDKIPNRLRAFKISRTVPVNMILQRDLTTFLREVVQSLPRARIASLMARKVSEGGELAKLYQALRANEFQQLVANARQSSNLKLPISKLSKYNINVDELMQLFFELLSWGPKV